MNNFKIILIFVFMLFFSGCGDIKKDSNLQDNIFGNVVLEENVGGIKIGIPPKVKNFISVTDSELGEE